MEVQKKSNKGLIILVVVIIVLFVLTVVFLGYGYTKYNKLERDFNSLQKETTNVKEELNKAKKELDKSKNEVKDLEESANKNAKYEFDLSKIKCTEGSKMTCTKVLDVRYNGANHSVKIVSTKKKSDNQMKITYNIYVDNNKFYTIDGGLYDTDIVPENNIWGLDGYVYIIDSKNLGFVLPNYYGDKRGYDVTFLTSNGTLIKRITADFPYTVFGTEDVQDLDSISNLQFDGHTLKIWDLHGTNKVIQWGITIENDKFKALKIQTVQGSLTGGQSESGACKINCQ